MKRVNITPKELAERWNIPYISDTSSTHAWQQAFMALGVATGYLDQREYEIEKLYEKFSILDNDLEFYQRAMELASEKYDFDLRDHLDEVDSEFETN
jgi:hypothetical protein